MSAPILRLPVEVMGEILGRLSFLDILRLQLVSRAFHDVVLSCLLVLHKSDLRSFGFEYNPMVGVDLIEARRAFHQYISNLSSLSSWKEKTVNGLRAPSGPKFAKVVGGVHTMMVDTLRLFTLGSASRGLPYREWEIPLPPISVDNYGFSPDADIIAFAGWRPQGNIAIIHLRSLSSGRCHPAVRHPTIQYGGDGEFRSHVMATGILSTSISNSRLAVSISAEIEVHMVIWDWKSGEKLYVLKDKCWESAEFVDDYRLLAIFTTSGDGFDGPPCVLLIDTEKAVGGTPAQTSFYLPPCFSPTSPTLLLGRGGHKPSPTDRLTPFYQDPTQRIAVLDIEGFHIAYLAFPVEALLELAKGNEGCEIEWDGWKTHAILPSTEPGLAEAWVSGCRFFHFKPGPDAGIEVYDFSARGLFGRLSQQAMSGMGVVNCLQPTGVKLLLPYHSNDVHVMDGDRESIVFFHLTEDETEYDGGTETEEGSEPESGGNLHIWFF